MTRYLIRQILFSILKLFIFLTIMFFFVQLMMPGDFADQFALILSPEQRENLRIELGLDLPIWTRYYLWLRSIVSLNLGTSFGGEPIFEIFKEVVPATLLIFLTGTMLAFVIGLWVGKRTAWRGPGILSGATTLGGIAFFTSFPPWLTWLASYLFTGGRDFVIMGEVGGLRGVSYQGLDMDLWRQLEIEPSVIASRMILTLIVSVLVFLLLDSLLNRFVRRQIPGILLVLLMAGGAVGGWYALQIQFLAFDILKIGWLAIITFTLLSFGETMLIMQSSMEDVMKEDYIIQAKAKGLSSAAVRERHAARNAILPVLSRLMISLPYLITGVVIIESSVGWPGMGTNMWNALYWQNMPVVMATLLIVGFLSLIGRLILDVITAFMDPRIRFDENRVRTT
jgi:peptide/nickel transport system permease protein